MKNVATQPASKALKQNDWLILSSAELRETFSKWCKPTTD